MELHRSAEIGDYVHGDRKLPDAGADRHVHGKAATASNCASVASRDPGSWAMASMTGADRIRGRGPVVVADHDMTPPTTETTPGATNLNTNWLTIVNLYRTLLKLQPVEEDPARSQGCWIMRNIW